MLKHYWKSIALAGLLASIFAMAGLYYAVWLKRPDYFRIADNVNFLPLDLASSLLEHSVYGQEKPLPEDLIPTDAPANAELASLRAQDHEIAADLAQKDQEFANSSAEDARLGALSFASIQALRTQYINKKAAPYDDKIAGLDKTLKDMLDQAHVGSANELPADQKSTYAKLATERDNVVGDAARTRAEAQSYFMSNSAQFNITPEQQAYITHVAKTIALQTTIDKRRERLREVRAHLIELWTSKRHDQVLAKLSYWDFVYFSVGAATTATFGDISPNHTSVRLLVCAQVLLSVGFVSFMINKLAGSS